MRGHTFADDDDVVCRWRIAG